MSNIYHLEPPTKGKVVLHTTFGDVDVELWAREVRRFDSTWATREEDWRAARRIAASSSCPCPPPPA